MGCHWGFGGFGVSEMLGVLGEWVHGCERAFVGCSVTGFRDQCVCGGGGTSAVTTS